MLISQTRADLEASRIVGANVTLRDIRLAYIRAQSEPPSLLRVVQNSAPQITSKPRIYSLREENLILPIELSLKVPNGEAEEFMISIDCTFEADYTVKAGFEPTQEQLRAFHEANAIFNCWPFFRELVHSFCTRMGHVPIAVPLLRLGLKPGETSKNNDEKTKVEATISRP